MSLVDLLRRISLFADLPDDGLVPLADCLGRRIFAEDMLLYQQGSPAQSLYLIESGTVRVFALSETGQEITLEVYGPDECFGETALLDGNVRISSAVALQKTVTYTLGRDDFLRCLESHPQVARRVIELLVHRLEHAIVYAENLAFLDVAGRVAVVLLELAERSRTDGSSMKVGPELTQSELASWCGASREMVNKVLRAYRDRGVITMDGHSIVILEPDGLRCVRAC